MALTARMARLKMPNFRCRTSRRNYQNTGNALFTGPFHYTNPCIKNVVLIEPFGGSGSTLIAATKMKRRCFIMEKCPAYAEVIKKRWENLTGLKGILYEKQN